MAILFIQNNLYYSCEILHADGRCYSQIFTGSPLKARELALTEMLEHIMDDNARADTFVLVSLHHYKTKEKVTITSSCLLHQPHEGLQMELDLLTKERVKTEKVLFHFDHPDLITLLDADTNIESLKNFNAVIGVSDNWTITFGRKKTRMNLVA